MCKCQLDAVAAGIITMKYIKSKYNIADALTKPLAGNVHYSLWKYYLFKPLQEKGEYQHMREQQKTDVV